MQENQEAAETQETAATPASEASATSSPPGADVEEQLKQAQLQAEEHRDAWLRARAESDNIRRRAQTDVSNAHKYATENFATELLAVKDSLEAALASTNSTNDSMRSGVELTLKQLNSVFDKFNLAEINPAGQKFDPHRHQAISTIEAQGEPNTVAQVFQKGYLLNDRVIRPAMVSVSKALES